MASLYAPQYLASPLHVQGRLPPVLQSVDLEVVMVLHSALALLASNFWVHQPWALPLALFGLIACMPSLSTNLLPHFLAFWIASIPLDVIWLIHRSDQARSIVISIMGLNMCFKLVSAGQAARILQSHGAIPDVDGFGGSARPWQPWLGGGTTAPFGLPGSWSGAQQNGTAYRDAPYTPNSSNNRTPAPAAYQSIYDEEAGADADERDAPQVHVDNIASSVAAAAAASGGQRGQQAEQAKQGVGRAR